MSLYIIEDDDGNVLTNDGDFDNNIVYAALYDEPLEPAKDIERYGGHVVTLTEEPKKIILPKAVADELERAKECKDSFDVYIMRIINGYTIYDNSHVFWSNSGDGVIKTLMDAWDNGYTVEKEKKYNVKVPHTKDGWYYISWNSDLRTVTGKEICSDFTESEIERYGLQDCEKEEVTDED